MWQPFRFSQQRSSFALRDASLTQTVVCSHTYRLLLRKSPGPLEKPALGAAETASLIRHQVFVAGLDHILLNIH